MRGNHMIGRVRVETGRWSVMKPTARSELERFRRNNVRVNDRTNSRKHQRLKRGHVSELRYREALSARLAAG